MDIYMIRKKDYTLIFLNNNSSNLELIRYVRRDAEFIFGTTFYKKKYSN